MNARAAIVGIGYQLWSRTRWVLLAILGQIAVLTAAAHLLRLPEMAFVVVAVGALTGALTVPFLIRAFTYDGDISAAESTFPRHMMVLPLGNAALALTPILYGIVCLTTLLVMMAHFALVPVGCPAPTVWFVLLVAAVQAWLCAVSWTPFWFPYGRVIGSVAVLSAIAGFVLTAKALMLPNWVTIAGLLAAMGLGFAAAIAGVARARRGDGTVAPRWIARLTIRAKHVPSSKPFISAERAQIWFELRRNCTAVAFFVLGITACTIHLLWVPSDGVGSLVVPIPFFPTLLFLVMPIFTLSFVGGNFAKPDSWNSKLAAPAFLATRPVSDNFLIGAKLKAAALTIIVVWGFVFANVGISLPLPHWGHSQTLAQFLHREFTPRRAAIAVLLLAALVFLSGLAVIKTFAHNLYGNPTAAYCKFFINVLLLSLLPLCARWAWLHPDARDAMLSAVRICVGILIAAKIVAAIPIIRGIRHKRIATDIQLRTWTAIWLSAAAILLAIVLWLVPPARHSALSLIAGIVLFLPYNRVIVMPLAWHHNRHR